MTRFRIPTIITLGLLSAGTTIADDAQAYLRAISRRDASACYNVMDADKRTLCIAEIKGDPALCYSVIDPAVRAECMVRAKAKK